MAAWARCERLYGGTDRRGAARRVGCGHRAYSRRHLLRWNGRGAGALRRVEPSRHIVRRRRARAARVTAARPRARGGADPRVLRPSAVGEARPGQSTARAVRRRSQGGGVPGRRARRDVTGRAAVRQARIPSRRTTQLSTAGRAQHRIRSDAQVALTALSVAMAWLFMNTRGSVGLAMLMHSATNHTDGVVPRPVATPGSRS